MSLPRLVPPLLLLTALSTHAYQYNPEPSGGIRILWRFEKITRDIEEAREAAGQSGKDEHYSGYPLSTEREVRRKQMMLHYAALEEEEHLLRVLANAKDAKHRAIAATAIGYGRQSQKQLDALSRACSDPDGAVRQNAVRALRYLVAAKPQLREKITARVSID